MLLKPDLTAARSALSLTLPVTQRDDIWRSARSCSVDDWLGDVAGLLKGWPVPVGGASAPLSGG
jgi:hypothetical protein